MDITQIINKYGPEIAKNLQIATSQVYSKVIWYTKVDGIVGLTQVGLIGLLGLIYFYVIHRWLKKNELYTSNGDWVFIYLIVFMPFIFLCMFITLGLVPNIMKIVAPEYWIMQSIINKVN